MEAELNVCYTTSNVGRRGVDLWSNGEPWLPGEDAFFNKSNIDFENGGMLP
jgi:hypothetical protein